MPPDPAISVIVPVYNDPEGLETTVESLVDQTANDYEILIADNGSTDETPDVARAYAQQEGIRRVTEEAIQSPGAARNAGIEAARGDVLAFIDADMWVESDWLQRVRDRMIEDDVRYLGCNVQYVAIERTVPARYLVKQNRTLFEWYLRADSYAPAGSLVVTQDVVDEVGGFDPRLCSAEDYEFGRRVERAGIDQVFAHDIVMYHPARSSVVSLLRRQHRIGRGKAQLSRYDDGLDSGTASFESKLRRDAVVMRETLTDEPLVLQILFLVLGVLLKSSALAGRIHERLRAATAIAGGS